MPQQIPQTLDNGKPEAQPPASLMAFIVNLMKLLENRVKLPFWDAKPGIPDLNAQLFPMPPATEQDPAFLGVFHGIRQQVADHLLEEAMIAADRQMARNHAPAEPVGLGVVGELRLQLRKHVIDRNIDNLRTDHAGLELVDVQKCI